MKIVIGPDRKHRMRTNAGENDGAACVECFDKHIIMSPASVTDSDTAFT